MATKGYASSRSESFSAQVKSELAQLKIAGRCCRRAELAALLRTVGSLVLGGDRRLQIVTEHSGTARRFYLLGKSLYGWRGRILTRQRQRLKKNRVFMVEVPLDDAALDGLCRLGLVDAGGSPRRAVDSRFLDSRCCRRAYLRGCFLGSGSVLSPDRGYHLSLTLSDDNQVKLVRDLLGFFGMAAMSGHHRGAPILYLKEGQAVAMFLQVVGAHQSLLRLEGQRILRDIKNQANRKVNAETANLDKTIRAGLRQSEAVARLDRAELLGDLPGSYRQLARLRMERPDLSLRELGELIVPPISKSAVSYRMKRMESMAEKIERGGVKSDDRA